jgi:ribosomal protein L39E
MASQGVEEQEHKTKLEKAKKINIRVHVNTMIKKNH